MADEYKSDETRGVDLDRGLRTKPPMIGPKNLARLTMLCAMPFASPRRCGGDTKFKNQNGEVIRKAGECTVIQENGNRGVREGASTKSDSPDTT